MKKEFGTLKGLMGANGLSGGDIMLDIGRINPISTCESSCSCACIGGCTNGSQNGREDH